jgi:hypothetical protein
MPDVRLPDGTIIKDVPEGTSKNELIRRLSNAGYDVSSLGGENATGLSDSNIENFLAGAGKGMTDIVRGARQRATDILSMIPASPLTAGSGIARVNREKLQQEAAERRELDAPLVGTKAGFAGEMAGNIAAFAPFGGAITSVPRAIALGATEGALIPTTSDQETGFNIAAGGALGGAGDIGARGVRRLFQPFGGSGGTAADVLQREGVDLDVAQRTGSEGAQRVRSALGDNPLTAGNQRRFIDRQNRQFTRAVLRTVDIDADELTPKLLNDALDDVGRQIDSAAHANPMFFDTQFAADLARIQQRIPLEVGDAGTEAALLRNIDRLFNSVAQNGTIPGGMFTGLRSSLSKLSTKTPLAREMVDSMLDALNRSGGDAAQLRGALAKFRNLKLIQNSLDKGTEKTISPRRLVGTLNQIRNRTLSQRRLGHPSSVRLAEIAEAGADLIPETLGNSGTFGRQIVGQGILGAGAFGGATLAGQDTGEAAAIGAGAAIAPLALQRAFLNQGSIGNFLSRTSNASDLIDILIRQGIISGGLQQER